MNPTKKCLPLLSNSPKNENPMAVIITNVVFEGERVLGKCKNTSMFTSADSLREISNYCYSRAKAHMSPFISDLTKKRMINRSCTYGNKAQLRALAVEDVPIEANVRGKDKSMAFILKDVCYGFPEHPVHS